MMSRIRVCSYIVGWVCTLYLSACAQWEDRNESGEFLYRRAYESMKRQQNSMDFQRYPKISTHEHYWTGGDLGGFFSVMDRLGIEKAIFVPTGIGPDNRGYEAHLGKILENQREFPERVIAFATVDEQDPNAARVLEEAIQRGARGLKLIGGHPHFYDEPLDSPPMKTVYEVCRKHKIPVLIHISPLNFPEHVSQMENVLREFPDLKVIAAHYAKSIPKFSLCRRLLDTYPNLLIDLSMGGRLKSYEHYVNKFPDKFRNFIVQYQDRILWGSDMIVGQPGRTNDFFYKRMRKDLVLFERRLYVDEFNFPGRILWGMNLPDSVLRKIYRENFKRLFPELDQLESS